MKFFKQFLIIPLSLVFILLSCKKNRVNPSKPGRGPTYNLKTVYVNGSLAPSSKLTESLQPDIQLRFNAPINGSTLQQSISLTQNGGTPLPIKATLSQNDSVITIQPQKPLADLTQYQINVAASLLSKQNGNLSAGYTSKFMTGPDPSKQFPTISDDSLLTLVQKQTFRYFWDFAHPVSGFALERDNGNEGFVTNIKETAATGGTGFGLMDIVVAIERNFISKAQGLERVKKIVNFVKTKVPTYHGAFSHWYHGTTGATIAFWGKEDNGHDLTETSYFVVGLLTLRQYFNGNTPDEVNLRNDINNIYQNIDWNFFRNNTNRLIWHWSPNYGFAINMPISGWNEALITYILAASSPTHPIDRIVYDQGWAHNGALGKGMVNGATYYGYKLPLGYDLGGPLFFEHYTFMGIDPRGLSDAYANYETQTKNHTLINRAYCIENSRRYFGYSDSCWGITSSDSSPTGYESSSPTNDHGIIAPTAALSSFPYTPVESMKALKYFYYRLGYKIWGPFGFSDAFNFNTNWYATSHLAIDQGPIIGMIENYRTGLLWKLFTSCPEIKVGLRRLGFTAPYI